MELKDLTGCHKLSGVDYSRGTDGEMNVLFCLDGVTYEAKENPCDGYRSYMNELEVTEKRCSNTFPEQPVFCLWTDSESYVHGDDLLVVHDLNSSKVVLKVGTCNTYDYYPYCVMEYHPENMSCNQ